MKKNSRMPRWSISPKLVVGEGAPGVINLDRAGGLATVGVALVHGDAAEVVLENLHGVEHLAGPAAHDGVKAAARGHQQGETGPDLIVVDSNIASLVKTAIAVSPS